MNYWYALPSVVAPVALLTIPRRAGERIARIVAYSIGLIAVGSLIVWGLVINDVTGLVSSDAPPYLAFPLVAARLVRLRPDPAPTGAIALAAGLVVAYLCVFGFAYVVART